MSNWSEELSQGATLLTVNQRLARHQMAHYQRWQLAEGNLWWETPEILPFRSWLSLLHKRALTLGLTDLSVVPPLLVKRAWHRVIENDSTISLLDSAGAARSALKAWELSCAWQCTNSEDLYLSADQFAWQRWMKRYRSWLDTRQGVDEPLLADVLVDVLKSATAEQHRELLPHTLILDGFIQLPSQLQSLMDVVSTCGTRVEVQTNTAHAVVHANAYRDDDAELLAIASQMRAELEHNSQQSLGLVVPDLQQRRDAVVRAFERVFYPVMSPEAIQSQTIAYEISLGQSLSEQPVINMALMLLRLSASSISANELSATLLSPYWKAANAEARRREQLDRRLRENRIGSLTLEQLIDELYKNSELRPACKTVLRQRKLSAATLSEWASRFSLWLKTLGWPTGSIDSEEYQAVSAWLECLDDLQLLDDGAKPDFAHAYGQLKSLAGERVFQTESSAKPIQVMGRLESHALDFDCLWVAGLDGEQWPPEGSANPFLSISEQKACGVPDSSASGRLALAEKEFNLWASQAPLLITSCAQLRQGKQLGAALLPQIEPSANSVELAQPILARLAPIEAPESPAKLIAESLNVVAMDDHSGPALNAGVKLGGGARLFENQALCPFRAFAFHRLKIRPLEEVGIGLDPRQHGNLLHKALEYFWQTLVSHEALMALSEEALESMLQQVVQQAMVDTKVPEKLQSLELTRLTRLLHEWVVQCEKPRQPFTVVAFEQKLGIEHGGVLVDVVIDRIDKVADASVVVDYKTGVSSKVAPWADERIANPQLPLYVLSDEEIEAATFAQVSVNQCRFIGIASDENTLPKVSTKLKSVRRTDDGEQQETPASWEQWRTHWQGSLDAIAAELRQGVATVTPMKSACTFCELKSLCRISSDVVKSEDADAQAQSGAYANNAGATS